MRKTVYWMEGDGIGPEIWRATRPVLDAAVRRAYGDGRGLDWVELAAGEKAVQDLIGNDEKNLFFTDRDGFHVFCFKWKQVNN